MSETRRVLIVDDSRTVRLLLAEVLGADPSITVIGQAADGAEAVALVKRLRPSIVVMDINMPDVDGIEATRRIMIEHPTPILIVTDSYSSAQVEISLKAVGAGALTVAPKPAGPAAPTFSADAARLVTLVKALADVKVVRQRVRTVAARPSHPPALNGSVAPERQRRIEAVGVAASTGGPAALHRFLSALPRTLDVPVLVVQHIATGFVDGLARWLATASPLPVRVVLGPTPMVGGEVYLAPDGQHLVAERDSVTLSRSAPVGGFRPSATVLFHSLAASHGAAAAAVVLTGMGEDGLEGAAAVRTAGGLVLAQDADSSVVFGMPQAVTRNGVAHATGTVDALAARIARSTSRKVQR